MFEDLSTLPADPLLGIITKFREDKNPNKIDLGVGVYKNAEGATPVFAAVKQAEVEILASENTKDYVGQLGSIPFGEQMAKLVFGEHANKFADRLAHIQAPGGCGALRLLAEIVKRTPCSTVWVSDPTWVNHVPLMGGAGLQLETYPYYDFDNGGLRFDAMLSTLQNAKQGDVVLLHGCCHNPSGADLNQEQWTAVIALCAQKGLVPLIDIAYQGLGNSLEEDVFGVRLACAELPEVLVSVSCSKNFALYRERVGSAFLLAKNTAQKKAALTHFAAIAREMYTMPPSHGAAVVTTILSSDLLRVQWNNELDEMRGRLLDIRQNLTESIQRELQTSRFDFIGRDRGLFSFLGISEEKVNTLAEDFSIYMAGSSRINLAGLNDTNILYFASALREVL